jgi:hypothetical protein
MICINASVGSQKIPATYVFLFQAFKIITASLWVALAVDKTLLKQVRTVKASVVGAFQ